MNNLAVPLENNLVVREAGNWVKYKLYYLERYVNIFETSMRGKWSRRFYIDLLAGCGKNKIRLTNEIILGSPFVALNVKFPFTDYIFNESNKESYLALEKRILSIKHPSNLNFFNGDCNMIIDEIIAIIQPYENSSLNFAFLDPEGLEVEWNTLEKLAKIKRMDLLIYYPEQAITRLAGLSCKKQKECLIDRFFGGKEWRSIYLKLKKKNQLRLLHRKLIDFFRSKLSSLGYVDFSTDHILELEPLMSTSKTNAPLYRLIFASKHKLGNSFWKSVVKKDPTGQKTLF